MNGRRITLAALGVALLAAGVASHPAHATDNTPACGLEDRPDYAQSQCPASGHYDSDGEWYAD